MTPEERLMEMIVTELRALRTAQDGFRLEVRESRDDFHKDVHRELGAMQRDVHSLQRSIDNLELKMALISMAAGAAAAAVFQWVAKVFF